MSARHIAGAIAFTILVASTIASAQSPTTVHGTGTVSLGFTDNMFGSPSDPPPELPGPISVWFVELVPGILVIHDAHRAIHRFSYQHPFTLFLGHPEANQQSNVGAWNALFDLSPRDNLTLGLSAERSNTRLANLQAGADTTTASTQLTGDNVLLQTRLSQGYTREFSGQWRMTQMSAAGAVIPLDVPTPQPNRYEFVLGGGPEYTSGRNAYALLGESTYFVTTEVNEGGVNLPSAQQVVLSGLFRWRYDLTETWSTELRGGVAGAMRTDPIQGGVWGPIWASAIRYTDDGYEAGLLMQRTLGPDLLTARTMLVDQVLLAGGIPLERENNIVLRTGTGYSHSRALQVEESGFLAVAPFATPKSTDDARLITTFDTFMVDASVGWYPTDQFFHVEFRYQHLRQIGEESQIAPAITFNRNMGVLSVGGMWPSREVPRVPDGNPVRVDGTDRDDRVPGASHGPQPARGSRPSNN